MQKNKTPSFPIPTEAEEQIALFEWARLQTGRFPELALLYHVPNGGSRNKIEAARLRAQGVRISENIDTISWGGPGYLYLL